MIGRWQCRHPIPIEDKIYGGLKTHARCNRCVNCILRRKALWTGRNLLEWIAHGQIGSFITLTYDERTVGDACYYDVQLYLKRLRHLHPLRFYCVPDTGDQFGRFHWHLLLHNTPHDNQEFQNAIHEMWNGSITHSKPIIPERIGYTCGYVTKKLYVSDTGRANSSHGLGIQYFLDRGRELANQKSPLNAYPRLFTVGKSKFPLDQSCRSALKKGFIDAGGVPHYALDYAEKPKIEDRIFQVILNQRLGGSLGDKVTTEYFNGKTKTQTKTPKTNYYRPPRAPTIP